jgi:hypothetical protein
MASPNQGGLARSDPVGSRIDLKVPRWTDSPSIRCRVDRVRFPDFDLPRAGDGQLALGDMLGRPWIAYLARHPG